MSRNNLVPRTLTDRNGVQTTRWIRPATESKVDLAAIPKPVLPRGGVKELTDINRRLKNEIKSLQKDSYSSRRHYAMKEAGEVLQEAFEGRELEKLRVFDRYLIEAEYPVYLSDTVDALLERGHENIVDGFTQEFFEDSSKFARKVRTHTIGGFPETLKDLTPDERVETHVNGVIVMFENPGSGQKLYDLLVDRGTTKRGEFEALLQASEDIDSPLLGGAL